MHYPQRITLSCTRVAMDWVLWPHTWNISLGEEEINNKCSWLSELLKEMLKGSGRSVGRLEYCVLQPMLPAVTPVLDN